jgi:arylsulfatase A-like enzyme
MADRRPNVFIVMTDEERYPPPYEDDKLAEFRRTQLPGRQRMLDEGVSLHRHYAASAACLPSRASLFTGQYPSLHGVTNTDGLAKQPSDPAMSWLDPDTVPTMGDWFRAAGYRTHYRGKWHISHADLLTPGTHDGLVANDRDGNVLADAYDAYRRANRLDPFGFDGWIGPEPHGANPANAGYVRDNLFTDQVEQLFSTLSSDPDTPWLTVASLVNPHDIVFSGFGWQFLGFPEPADDTVPDIAAAPSQGDSLASRPSAQADFVRCYPQVLFPQPTDLAYRRFYYWLHKIVDACILRLLEMLDASGQAENTIVLFTSDHGDMLGAHGGMQQKWHTAYDEAIRVPMAIRGSGITAGAEGLSLPTSHVDIVPTLLGLIGAEPEALQKKVSQHHIEAQPLVGRDLSGMLTGSASLGDVYSPVYFNTEDDISRGLRHANRFTGKEYEPVGGPAKVESVITHLHTGADGAAELWKLNRFYDVLDEEAAAGPDAPPVIESQWELHNLSADPEERTDLSAVTEHNDTVTKLRGLLDEQRAAKHRVPEHVNP